MMSENRESVPALKFGWLTSLYDPVVEWPARARGGRTYGARIHAKTVPSAPASFAGGRFQAQRFLGEGGRKRVYLGHDDRLDRDVAIGRRPA